MNWYSGNIGEAVNLSKTNNSIFVVFVEGTDELSVKLKGFIDSENVRQKLESKHFVSIRLESGSQPYMQFAQIYQLVPLPSLFFIGKNGTPIEVVLGNVESPAELCSKIDSILEKSGIKLETGNIFNEMPGTSSQALPSLNAAASASASLITSEQSSRSVQSEGSKVSLTPEQTEEKENSLPAAAAEPALEEKPQPEIDHTTEKLERAKQLLEEKRKLKEAEDARSKREREIERRKQGQNMQTFKKIQKEQELKDLKDNILRERLEEQAARQRILEKIASDKAERAQKFGQNAGTSSQSNNNDDTEAGPKPVPIQKPTAVNKEFSKIQFRKPGGESETHTFNSSDKFQTVRDHVRNVILASSGMKNFSLATTFPRKEFGESENDKTLLELELCPTAVLLVIAATSSGGPSAIISRSGGFVNIFNSIFWGILSPFFTVFGYIKDWFSGNRPPGTNNGPQKRANEDNPPENDAAKRRNLSRFMSNSHVDDQQQPSTSNQANKNSAAYRRNLGGSNIHRLRDNKESDDENNTWNGNSTQQQ